MSRFSWREFYQRNRWRICTASLAVSVPCVITLADGLDDLDEVVLEIRDTDESGSSSATGAAQTQIVSESKDSETAPARTNPGCCRDPEKKPEGDGSGNSERTDPNADPNANPVPSRDDLNLSNLNDRSLAQTANVAGSRLDAPNMIGDLLRSSGQVRVNYTPRFATLGNSNGTVKFDASTNSYRFTTDGTNFVEPVAGGRFVYFTADGGGVITSTPGQRITGLKINTVPEVDSPSTAFSQTAIVNGTSTAELVLQSDGTFVPLQSTQSKGAPANPAFANVGLVKVAEGASPIPQDRFTFGYSSFTNVPIGDGITLNRFTPGLEKTFWEGDASVEIRVPFATTLTTDFVLEGGNSSSEIEFGDILLGTKFVLAEGDSWLISGGLQISLPTADDLRFFSVQSDTVDRRIDELIRIKNQTVHVMPFLASVYQPDDRWFVQTFAQVDFDTVGKDVFATSDPTASPELVKYGRLNDATFLYADISVGYWLRKDGPQSQSFFTGIAPMVELHYNRSLTKTDGLDLIDKSSSNFGSFATVGARGRHIEILNATLGCAFQVRQNHLITLAYATPLAGGNDKEFDGEFRALYSWNFGRGGGSLALPGLSR